MDKPDSLDYINIAFLFLNEPQKIFAYENQNLLFQKKGI